MKYLPLILALVLYACNQPVKDPKPITTSDTAQTKPVTTPTNNAAPKVLVGLSINGDFDGDGQAEEAAALQRKVAKGNPAEDGTEAEYGISFPGKTQEIFSVGCCDIRLINEGDLNHDGNDDISVFQAPMNGCTYTMTTYTYKNGNWKKIIAPFLFPTFCDAVSDEDLQKRIFVENNNVYFYETDMSDEKTKFVKKKAILK